MRIKVDSRSGHFNLLDLSEEFVLTTIRICEGEKVLKKCVIRTEDTIDSNDLDDVKYEIQKWFSRISCSTREAEVKEMANFLEENADKLVRGNRIYKLEQLRKQKDEIDKKITILEDSLKRDKIKIEEEEK